MFSGKTELAVGRGQGNDVVFEDANATPIVSIKHAKIELIEGRVILVDLESKNGTFVNGKRIRSATLGPNDDVTLGTQGPSFRVVLDKDALAATSPALFSPALPAAAAPLTVPDAPEPDASPKLYGQRTVGLMIRQALASLTRSPTRNPKSTADIEALVEKRVRRVSTRFKRLIAIAVATVLVAAAIAGWLIFEHGAVRVTQVNYGSATGGAIAAANRYNVFLLAGVPTKNGNVKGARQGFCTAFAVGEDLLATNAHCILTGSTEFSAVEALMNGAPAKPLPVIEWGTHAGYREGTLSPDVGIVRVRGRLPSRVVLAGSIALASVAPGATMFLYGFPGRLNNVEAPEATFIEGDIGRVTGFDLRVGSFESNTLLQHSAYCTSGTSGSPIFDTSGRVVGINAGGYLENGQALAGYNFGMRVDLLDTLLAHFRAPPRGNP